MVPSSFFPPFLHEKKQLCRAPTLAQFIDQLNTQLQWNEHDCCNNIQHMTQVLLQLSHGLRLLLTVLNLQHTVLEMPVMESSISM